MIDSNTKQKHFGSMYINGRRAAPNTHYSPNDGQIAFGDTVADRSIPWILVNDMWIAGAVYAPGVTWADLNREGFILGQPIRIDGKPYLCRGLKVGVHGYEPCSDDELWHWRGRYFIGQEHIRQGKEEKCVIRGLVSPRDFNKYNVCNTNICIGFRPVLEELPTEPTISDELLGSTLTVYGNGQALGGLFVDYTDYDLILASGFDVDCPAFKGLAHKCGSTRLAVNRMAITYLSTTDNPHHPPVTKAQERS